MGGQRPLSMNSMPALPPELPPPLQAAGPPPVTKKKAPSTPPPPLPPRYDTDEVSGFHVFMRSANLHQNSYVH